MTENSAPVSGSMSGSVSTSTTADQVGSGARSAIIYASGVIASGLFHDGALTAGALAAAPAVLAALWGVMRWRKTHRKLSDLADLWRELTN